MLFKSFFPTLVLLICLISCALFSAQPAAADFSNANWVWFNFGSAVPLSHLPASVCYLRAELQLPEKEKIKAGEVIITCDNLFALYLNGHNVGECEPSNNAWGSPKRYDVTPLLASGRNVLAVEAVNTLPGPAGLIAKLQVRLADGSLAVLASDATWKCSDQERLSWQKPEFDDSRWRPVTVFAKYGSAPWGRVVPGAMQPAGDEMGQVHAAGKRVLAKQAMSGWTGAVVETAPGDDFDWPEAVIYVGEDCSLYRPSGPTQSAADSLTVTIFNPRKSRTFPEHDLPAPMKVGHKLFVIKPAKPGIKPKVLLDAGKGGIGSPSVSFDGKTILVSMALDGAPFFHIYRLDADGGNLKKLTDGPFHDIDPAELPDGRIVFTSTRIGTFEEYHNPPSRALFVMNADGSNPQALTHTIIFDNEPEVLADGRIVFIRSDNFFDRGKVETLLHAIHPDGTSGYTEFGLDNGPEYGGRLRAFLCGSPAPMPDGRLAFLSGPGITIGTLGATGSEHSHFRLAAGDVAAMSDGRLLCTVAGRYAVTTSTSKGKQTKQDLDYRKISVMNPASRPPTVTTIYEAPDRGLHSPVYLGPRKRPAVMAKKMKKRTVNGVGETGFLFCQNTRFTRNDTAGWSHIRAIRVLKGKGLTVRSSHSYIVHAGSDVSELGTVPLAPDGSFFVEVPANTPIALQAVDAEGRSELNEMSWIYLRPGERRSCIGCHHHRQAAPANAGKPPMAVLTRPLRLLGQGNPHRFRGNNAAVTGLMEMQIDRYREVAGINRHGQEKDPLSTGKDEVNTLIAQLRGDDAGLKISAAQRLSIFRDATAAAALAECLADDSREVRVACLMALAACGTRASIHPLFNALTDADPLAAQAAAIAIENLTGHKEPFDPFATPEKRDRQARSWRQWFEKTKWQGIERDLLSRLESSNRDVVRRAAVALGHTGGPAAAAGLRKYVQKERSNNPLPEWRKRHRGDGARFNSLSAVNPRTLQAAARALGYLKDAAAVPLLKETALQHKDPNTGNLFLAEAVVEALGDIATPAAEDALVAIYASLGDYPRYTYWYGDHEALMACHASPVHYFVAEALDDMGSKRAAAILPGLIQSIPVDPDRALLLENDDCETLIGRVIRRNGAEEAVVETCLAILGDPGAKKTPAFEKTINRTHRCWGGHPRSENRAAQLLSMVCRDRRYEPRIRAAFERYSQKPTTIDRVYNTGIPVVLKLPLKHWVCFYLARALGNLGDPASVDSLMNVLSSDLAEAATGYPDPLGPGVLFLHNDLTPCWRAAAAWALGRIGDPRAADRLLKVVADLNNATDTRNASAEALGRLANGSGRKLIMRIAKLAENYPETSTQKVLLRICDNS